jgi:2-polyprenyl-3-methyl-5-hydroxy-6-metoxy-1,4-benzoquinol methylase
MAAKEKKDFDKEAAAWDENPVRVKLANDVADAIIAEARPANTMETMDFGCGTGLVTLRIHPLVKMITGVDSSQGMLAVLEAKVKEHRFTNVQTRRVDFEHGETIKGIFDLIISSMTLHHVPETAPLIKQLYEHLRSGGTLCLADLDKEDGSFHSDNTGVFHYGFDRPDLKRLFEAAGFAEVRDTTAARIVRPSEKGNRAFSVFLVIGQKR